MDIKEILSKCDHTLLGQASTWEEIKAICDDGMKFKTASVCIPASFVKQAKEYVGDRLAICTVIGFPNGYSTTKVKCLEAFDAVENGADEVDMVINIGWAKDGKWAEITEEIAAIKQGSNRFRKITIRPPKEREWCIRNDCPSNPKARKQDNNHRLILMLKKLHGISIRFLFLPRKHRIDPLGYCRFCPIA